MIMIAEKGPGWTNIKLKGQSGHASMPYGINNLSFVIGKILSLIEENPPEIVITKAWIDTIKGLGLEKVGEYSLLDPTTADKAIEVLAQKNVGLARFFYSCLRMTVAPTIIQSGAKANVFPDRGVISLDLRMLPGQTFDDVKKYFQKILPEEIFENIELEQGIYYPGSDSPWNDPFITKLGETYSEMYAGKEVIPMLLPAVTDSRTFRKIGMKCYGFSVLNESIDLGKLLASVHSINESIPINSLFDTTDYFVKFAQKF